MMKPSPAQTGSVLPLILLSGGFMFVIVVFLIGGSEWLKSETTQPLQRAIKASPQQTSSPVMLLAFGGYPITPTPFQPLPTPTSTSTFTSTSTPQPDVFQSPLPTIEIPSSAKIENIRGYPQTLNLSCESRSAVDWASYFGVSISELEFLSQLPKSDDPNKGFVGNPNGPGGLVPPYPYGVHAAPVAALLRAYGLPAEDVVGMSVEKIKEEIAAARPVIVWIIFGTAPGYALQYTTQAGEVVNVAPNEHTAILIGYDPEGVTLLDGAAVYWRSWDAFLQSFQVLDNMAVIYQRP